MIYNKPMGENKSTAEFLSRRFKACGPMITPDRMSPIIPGILIFLKRIGESRMINKIRVNMRTELVKGVSKA